jgi:hypothetical protein
MGGILSCYRSKKEKNQKNLPFAGIADNQCHGEAVSLSSLISWSHVPQNSIILSKMVLLIISYVCFLCAKSVNNQVLIYKIYLRKFSFCIKILFPTNKKNYWCRPVKRKIHL